MKNSHVKFNRAPLHPETKCYESRVALFASVKNFIEQAAFPQSVTLLLHGSYATGKITEYSDIDVLAIFAPHKNQEDRKALKHALWALTCYLHRIDPLMHHGVDFIDEGSLRRYDESLLPIDALAKSIVLHGAPEISITASTETGMQSARVKLHNFCTSVIDVQTNWISTTPYKVKAFLSTLFLIPVLLLQAEKGVFLYKRESLEIARSMYAKDISFEAIDAATIMREKWRVSKSTLVLRKLLSPFESKFYSPLYLQRLSGAYPLGDAKALHPFLRTSKRFASEVLNYAKEKNLI
jgi:predicted nucleotidyltransferase